MDVFSCGHWITRGNTRSGYSERCANASMSGVKSVPEFAAKISTPRSERSVRSCSATVPARSSTMGMDALRLVEVRPERLGEGLGLIEVGEVRRPRDVDEPSAGNGVADRRQERHGGSHRI